MSRIALISDIHSNAEALEQVLCAIDAEAVDAIWCLGDVVGYGHDPVWCLHAIEDRADVILAGNHDLAVAGLLDMTQFNEWARAGVRYSRRQLTAHAPDLLRRLGARSSERRLHPGSQPIGSGSSSMPNVLLAHSCPTPFDPVSDYIELDVCARMVATELGAGQLAAVGHTHDPFVWFERADGREQSVRPRSGNGTAHGFEVDLRTTNKVVLNVGSVGQPRDGDWRACWTLLDLDEYGLPERVRWNRCTYDVDRAITRIAAAELPTQLGLRLKDGR